MKAVTASPAVAGVSSAKSKAVEAPGATRRWGGAMLVFLPAPSVTLSNSIPGILEAVPPTPVGLKQPLLIPLTAVSTKPGQDHRVCCVVSRTSCLRVRVRSRSS